LQFKEASELERKMGIEIYLTTQDGIGGRIRTLLSDFIVREVLRSGLRAEVSPKWPSGSLPGKGSFLLCTLIKKGIDTLTAARELARALGIPNGLISFAGLKDAKAITAQFITIRGAKPGQLELLSFRNMLVVPVEFTTKPVNPSDLIANEFGILIRDIGMPSTDALVRLEAILGDLKELGGMPNFFGHQRFGTHRPVTHLIGRELVLGRVKEAVELLLTYIGPGEGARAREARSYLADTWDLKGFLELLPKGMFYEREVARHLIKRPRDYHGAIRKLPIKLRKLFVQAYQAYLFNRFLSSRAKEGLPLSEPLPGDWVVLLDEHGLPHRAVRASRSNLGTLRGLIKAGRASLALPIPGFRQEGSGGRQGEIEEAILEEEGISPSDFKVKAMPELSSPGQLRPALASFRLLEDPRVAGDELNPGRRAVFLSFRLPRGSYATCLLREVIKPRDLIKSGF